MKIGEKMKAVREARGSTQTSVAKKLGVAQAHISSLEKGRANPSSQLVKLFCRTFDVPEEWLLSEEEGPAFNQEETKKIGDSFHSMATKAAVGYLTVIMVELQNAKNRIRESCSVAWEDGGVNPVIFFGDDGAFKPIKLNKEENEYWELRSILDDLEHEITKLKMQIEDVKTKFFFEEEEDD